MDEQRDIFTHRRGFRNRSLIAAATATLGKGSSGAVDVLKVVRLLNNSDPTIRISAIQTLAGIGGVNNVPYVVQCLDDLDRHVRTAACRALGRMRAHSAKNRLYDALHDRNAEVRCAAAIALAEMGDRHGLSAVAKLVCTGGTHQFEALRSFNLIIDQKFPLNDRGLKQAIHWIKARQKFGIKF